jgi:hypothetical protein
MQVRKPIALAGLRDKGEAFAQRGDDGRVRSRMACA